MNLEKYNKNIQKFMRQILKYRGNDAKKTLEICSEMLIYGTQTAIGIACGFAYYFRGEVSYWLNDNKQFFDNSTKALPYLHQEEEWDLMAECYNRMGISTANGGNAPIAMDYYLNGLKYAELSGVEHIKSLIELNIGILYSSVGRYEEAKEMFCRALTYYRKNKTLKYYDTYMMCVYANLVKTYIRQSLYDKAEKIIKIVKKEHWEGAEDIDRLSLLTIEAIFYHKLGKIENRNKCIKEVSEKISKNMGIIDIFEDFEEYCSMLLETDMDEDFWKAVNTFEPIVKNARMLYFQMQTVALKLKYYRKNGKGADYLKAAGLFYEYYEIMEKENNAMAKTMLEIRTNLEKANIERKKYEKENKKLHQKSEIDELTQMANRYKLKDYAEQVFADSLEENKSLVVEILDIDYFKEYNDNYGHQAGDKCLIEISDIIKEVASENHGFCARYGGDEFIIIYKDIDIEKANKLGAKLQKKIKESNIEHRFSQVENRVTLSQGICWDIPKEEFKLWDFLHAADIMLYDVKNIGKNNYKVGTIDDSRK